MSISEIVINIINDFKNNYFISEIGLSEEEALIEAIKLLKFILNNIKNNVFNKISMNSILIKEYRKYIKNTFDIDLKIDELDLKKHYLINLPINYEEYIQSEIEFNNEEISKNSLPSYVEFIIDYPMDTENFIEELNTNKKNEEYLWKSGYYLRRAAEGFQVWKKCLIKIKKVNNLRI